MRDPLALPAETPDATGPAIPQPHMGADVVVIETPGRRGSSFRSMQMPRPPGDAGLPAMTVAGAVAALDEATDRVRMIAGETVAVSSQVLQLFKSADHYGMTPAQLREELVRCADIYEQSKRA